MFRRLVPIALAILLGSSPGRSWAAFEEVEVSPRLRATGGAGVAAEEDAYAALRNPASLAWAGLAGAGSYVQPFSLGFVSQNAVGATAPLPGAAGGVAIGVRSFGVHYLGEKLDGETTLSLAHGFRLLRDAQTELAVGWSVQYYALSFGTSITGVDPGRASTVGLGLGALAVVRENTRVGFAVQNLNNPSIGSRDHEELSRGLSGGVAYTPYAGVTALLDLSSALGENVEYRGGVEIAVTDAVQLRAGLCTEPNTFTTGLGVEVRGVRLDYGFSTGGGVLGDTHHVGIEVRGRAPWSAER